MYREASASARTGKTRAGGKHPVADHLLPTKLLQIDGLCETEAKTPVDAKLYISIFIDIQFMRVNSRRWVSFVAGPAFGEDAGRLDRDSPAAHVQAHQNDAKIARFKRAFRM